MTATLFRYALQRRIEISRSQPLSAIASRMLTGYDCSMPTARDYLMGLPTDFRRRMESWVRWRVTGGAKRLSVGVSSIYSQAHIGHGWRESRIPIMAGEAEDTDAVLHQIPGDLREAIEAFWVFEGDSFAECARRVGVDYRTFTRRLEAGHELLRTRLRDFKRHEQIEA
jgi:hypothetical protein